MTLSEPLRRQYKEQGFFILEELVPQWTIREAENLAHEIVRNRQDWPEELIQWEPAVLQGEYTPSEPEMGVRKLFRMARHVPYFRDFACRPELVQVVEALLGEDLYLLQSMMLMKSPECSTKKVWHQDNAYFHLTPPDVVGLWIACDPTDPQNGCMHLVPGSHIGGIVPHSGAGDGYGAEQDPEPAHVQAIPLAPGSVLVFHGELLHFTPANRSGRRRRAIQLHYGARSCQRKAAAHDFHLEPELTAIR